MGRDFEVYTDNNPLTYILTIMILDATGQRQVASLATYNFKLYYKCGKQNVEADILSHIPWEQNVLMQNLDQMAVNAIINRGCCDESAIPKNPPIVLPVLCKNLTVDSTPILSKKDLQKEQRDDPNIAPIIGLVNKKEHLQYSVKEGDPLGMRVLLQYRKDLMMKDGILYRKAKLKRHDQPLVQFILSASFRRKILLACHDDFGHLCMEGTLTLHKTGFLA